MTTAMTTFESMDSDTSGPENDDLMFGLEEEDEEELVSDGDDGKRSREDDDK